MTEPHAEILTIEDLYTIATALSWMKHTVEEAHVEGAANALKRINRLSAIFEAAVANGIADEIIGMLTPTSKELN